MAGPDDAQSVPLWKTLLREFVTGAIRPSLPGLLGIIVVAGGLFGACLVLITPRTLARIDAGYFMTSRFDSWVVHTSRVLELSEEGVEPGHIPVALFGTSALHHAVTSPEDLGSLIESESGVPVHVYGLWSDALRMWDITNAVGMMPERFEGVTVISVNALTFTRQPDDVNEFNTEPRAGFMSQTLKKEMRLYGYEPRATTGFYFLDQSRFFTARLAAVKNLLTGPKKPERIFDKGSKLPDPSRWQRIILAMNSRLERYDSQHEHVFESLGRIVEQLRDRGSAVVICEPPINPDAYAEFDQELFQRHEATMREFCEVNGVEYWDLREDVSIDPVEFGEDWTHLVAGEGRQAYTEELARRISELIVERGVTP